MVAEHVSQETRDTLREFLISYDNEQYFTDVIKVPGARFVECSMSDYEDVIELNKMLKAYADKEGLTYVDYHSAMKDERDGLPKNLASDEVHPTLEGYKIMEKIVLEAIHKTIGE